MGGVVDCRTTVENGFKKRDAVSMEITARKAGSVFRFRWETGRESNDEKDIKRRARNF